MAMGCVCKKTCFKFILTINLLWFSLMQGILGYGGKNAKMNKMRSLTSRKVRERDKVLHHST